MKHTITKFMLAAAVAVAPIAASAATVVGGYTYTPDPSPFALELYSLTDGSVPATSTPAADNLLGDGTVLGGELFTGSSTGAGEIVFKFTAAEDGLYAVNVSTTLPGSPFADLKISWCADAACTIEESSIIEPLDDLALGTSFALAGDSKYLMASWSAVTSSASNLDFRIVSAVPVPAAGFLLLGALGGLGVARRRRKNA